MIEATGGVYPLTPSVQARVVMMREYAASHRLLDDPSRLVRPMWKQLRVVAETSAADVSIGCVHVWQDEDDPDLRYDEVAFNARWMPPSAAPCELRGGPHDGMTLESVMRDAMGRPAEELSMPTASTPQPLLHHMQISPHHLPGRVVYRLIGFRNEPAVWVYDLHE